MRHSAVLVEDFQPTRTSKFIPRCVVLIFVSGIVFFCVYSVYRFPVYGSGHKPCACYSRPRPMSRWDGGRLLYNRVPKCGSTSVIGLLRRLAARNGFQHMHSRVYDRRHLADVDQRRLVQLIKETPAPCSFDRHVYFVNFTKFGSQPPIYFNVIREPVERIISSFFYRRMVVRQNRTTGKPSHYWLNKKFEQCVLKSDSECTFLDGESYNVIQTPYFCGQEPHCQLLNDAGALQRAKENIERQYAVVGVLENLNETLQVLEAMLPDFFDGAFRTYHAMGTHLNQNTYKEDVPEEVKAILRANLSAEYELYHFVRQRLHAQYQALVLDNRVDADQDTGLVEQSSQLNE